MNRRSFLGGLVAGGAVAALPGAVAAPPWQLKWSEGHTIITDVSWPNQVSLVELQGGHVVMLSGPGVEPREVTIHECADGVWSRIGDIVIDEVI